MKKSIAMVFTLLSLLTLFLGLSSSSVNAASANISRSYNSSTTIPDGSIVSLDSSKTDYIVPANIDNAQRLVGVVVTSNESLLAVNPSSGTVQVATDGTVNALVSTVNGSIKVGQQLAVSPFNGIGMKASAGDRAIGTVLTSFNSSSPGAFLENVKDTDGNRHSITVGYVRLSIGIGVANSGFSLQTFQQVIEGATGRPVSVFRVGISLVVALIAILSIVTLIYASIYGSIISIGRNPLAKFAVFRTLSSIIGMVTLIAGIGALSLYLLLY